MKKFEEKRAHSRVGGRWPVTILNEQGLVHGETVNIATTGAFVKCRGEFRKNEVCWMLIRFDRQSVMINGKALWLERDAGGRRGGVTGVGIRFEI